MKIHIHVHDAMGVKTPVTFQRAGDEWRVIRGGETLGYVASFTKAGEVYMSGSIQIGTGADKIRWKYRLAGSSNWKKSYWTRNDAAEDLLWDYRREVGEPGQA